MGRRSKSGQGTKGSPKDGNELYGDGCYQQERLACFSRHVTCHPHSWLDEEESHLSLCFNIRIARDRGECVSPTSISYKEVGDYSFYVGAI